MTYFHWNLILAGTVFGLAAAPAAAAVDVPLTVSNWATVPRKGEPVTAGVPLPVGEVTELSTLQIVDAAGNPVPAQFRDLSRWWWEKTSGKAAKASVKWVLCDFQTDVPLKESATFRLKSGASSPAPAKPLAVTEDADGITVTTGAIRFTVSKKRFTLLESAFLDANGDGQYAAAGEQIIKPDDNNGGIIQAGDWAAGQCVPGTRHTSMQKAPERVVIEENGPLKVVIRVEGRHYAAAAGVTQGLYGYQAFITAYAGKAFVDCQVALTNLTVEGVRPPPSANAYALTAWPFQAYSLDLNLNLGAAQSYGLLGATAATGTLSTGTARLLQSKGTFTVTAPDGNATGTNAMGAAGIWDGSLGVMVAQRDFAPNSPKAISLSANKLSLEFFPTEGKPFWLDPMSRKNHRFRLQFFSGVPATDAMEALWRATDAPLRMLAPQAWYRSTEAWDRGFGIPSDNSWRRRAPVDWTRRDKPSTLGWEKYGELPEFNGGGNHVNLTSCFWVYLLTGQPQDFEGAEAQSHYFNDIVPVHTAHTRWQDYKFMLDPEADLAAYGQLPGLNDWNDAKINSFPDFKWHRSNTPDEGHMPQMQALEYYQLTGDWATRDALESHGTKAAMRIFMRTYGAYSGWKYAEHKGKKVVLDSFRVLPYGPRYIARPGIVANHAYDVTGDSRYLFPMTLAAYSLRNTVRLSPVGYMGLFNSNTYLGKSDSVWKANNPDKPVPSYYNTSDFQIGIGAQAMYTYWQSTRDEEVRDALIFSAKSMEWRAAMKDGKYLGMVYQGWADPLMEGKRYSDVGLGGGNPEGLSGLIFGHLASGRPDLYKVITDTKTMHDGYYTYGNINLDYLLINMWQAVWKQTDGYSEPPPKVTDLAVTMSGEKAELSFTAPARAAEYSVKFAKAPLVDFPQRWDKAAGTGWPDMRDPIPTTEAALIARGERYKTESEMGFWTANSAKGEPAPGAAGSKEKFTISGLEPGTKYHIALVSYNAGGFVSDISTVASVTTGLQPRTGGPAKDALRFQRITPSPFTQSTRISFSLGIPMEVTLKVYGVKGQLIRTLYEGKSAAGLQSVTWDGRDSSGNSVGQGVYYCRLKGDGVVLERTVVKK